MNEQKLFFNLYANCSDKGFIEATPSFNVHYYIDDDFAVHRCGETSECRVGVYDSLYEALDAANEDYNKRRSV